MSQLLTQFFASVHEFNACKSPGDYQNLKRYYNKDATAYEVDPPNTKHGKGVTAGKDGNQDIVDYLALTQPALWPRFWPTQIKETPTNSDTALNASLDGLAIYFDSAETAPATSFVIKFHFDYTRTLTTDDWLVITGSGNQVL